MSRFHEYRAAGRSLLTTLSWVLTLALIAVFAGIGPATLVWPLWALASLGLVWHFHRHPSAGCRIGRTAWQIWQGHRRMALSLADIVRVERTDRWTAVHRDGSRTSLPERCLPPPATLAKWLIGREIDVVWLDLPETPPLAGAEAAEHAAVPVPAVATPPVRTPAE